jgi:hypothetical protein
MVFNYVHILNETPTKEPQQVTVCCVHILLECRWHALQRSTFACKKERKKERQSAR